MIHLAPKVRTAPLLLAEMVVLLASCASPSPVASPMPTRSLVSSQASRDALTNVPAPPWAAATIGEPVPMASGPGDVSLQWTFVSLSPEGRRIQIVYVGGDGWCAQTAGILIAETESSVMITATGTSRKEATVCPAMLKQYAGTVTLEAALGERSLIHAGVTERWKDVVPIG